MPIEKRLENIKDKSLRYWTLLKEYENMMKIDMGIFQPQKRGNYKPRCKKCVVKKKKIFGKIMYFYYYYIIIMTIMDIFLVQFDLNRKIKKTTAFNQNQLFRTLSFAIVEACLKSGPKLSCSAATRPSTGKYLILCVSPIVYCLT